MLSSKVILTLAGKEYIIEGFAEEEFISIQRDTEQLWHKLLGTKDGNYLVDCTDDNSKTWLATFTEDGYNKHIKDLKSSVKSPFCFTKQPVLFQGV